MIYAPPKGETTIATKAQTPKPSLPHLERLIITSLDKHKAEDVVSVNLTGKADFADRMVIASGTSQRHVGALAERVVEALKKIGLNPIPVEGQGACDWVLVDAGDVIVHIFRPEIRSNYNLEKMWSIQLPQLEAVH